MRCYSIYKTTRRFYSVFCGREEIAKFQTYKEAESYIKERNGRQFSGIKK